MDRTSSRIGIICVISVVILVNIIPSFAQATPNITVATDKSSYTIGDMIVISGQVKSVVQGTLLNIQILDSNNNLVQVSQIDISQDGKYTDTVKAVGASWKSSGSYTVIVQYGAAVTVQTTFSFTIPSPTSNVFVITDPNIQQTFPVSYTISGGMVKGMILDRPTLSLNMAIISTGDGSITLQIPRSLIDAKTSNGQDNSFSILIDGSEVHPQKEQASNSSRTLTIQFLQGNQQIAIIGTNIFNGPSIPSPSEEITVTTDKPSYNYGDRITISGKVLDHVQNIPIDIKIISPIGNLVKIDQVDVGSDRTYSVSTDANTNLWQASGIYQVVVMHGSSDRTTKTTFQFTGNGQTMVTPPLTNNNPYLGCPDCNNTSNIKQIPSIPITVKTDKPVYDHNSLIMITGHVANPSPAQIVLLKITSPSGNVVSTAQPTLDVNGYFHAQASTVGNLWFENGQYIVAVQKGVSGVFTNAAIVNSTTFQLTGVGPVIASPPPPAVIPLTPVFTPTQQDIQKINQAKANQTIAAEVNVGMNKSQTTSIDNNVSVQTTSTTADSLNVNVSASSQTGPKVIAFNLNATTINVANLKDLGVMYDGKLIQPAPNMDAILHAKPTDSPSFAIVVTQSGVQVLVLIPHFSTHTITITNMSKVIPAIPEFPFAILALMIATVSIVLIPKIIYR